MVPDRAHRGKSDHALHLWVCEKGGYLVARNAATLGTVKTGRCCIDFKKLDDLKLDIAMAS